MKVVPMVYVQIPAANLRNAHVVATDLGCLHFPDNSRAVVVLIANIH